MSDIARRRYISTKISLDKVVNRVAQQHGDFVALLYTWMVPHAEDDATLRGDPEEVWMQVTPGRRDKSTADIRNALLVLAQEGLILWNAEENVIQFPLDSFYEYQTYIPADKRRTTNIITNQQETPKNAEERRTSASNTVSPSPSPSPSLIEDSSSQATRRRVLPDVDSDAYRLATLLRSLVLKNNPKAKVPADTPEGLFAWYGDIDKLLRIDNRTPGEVEGIIRWSQSDPFWLANILSGKTLRAQFDKLVLKAGSKAPAAQRWEKPPSRLIQDAGFLDRLV